MNSRQRYSDPLTNFEKQTCVSFLNERQSIFDPPKNGEDVPDGPLMLLPEPKSEKEKDKKEPKKSNLKRENSKSTKNQKSSDTGVAFETGTGKVKFNTESNVKNNEKNINFSTNKELVIVHNNLTSEDSSEEFEFRKHNRNLSNTLSTSRLSFKSTKSSTYTNRSSRDSDFDEDLKFTTHLTVLKIIFIDIIFSLGDHITDFLQGFNLMFGDVIEVGVAAWSTEFLYQHWQQRGQYGLIVLLLNWSPGIIAVIHMLAYHRKEYAVQETSLMLKTLVPGVIDFKTKREHQIKRRKKFFLTMFLVLIFYPVIPAVTYTLLLWGWGNGQAQPESLSRRENFAMVAHSITGGFEAPVQLTMTIWLMLKGIIDNDFSFAKAFVDFGLPQDKFGNSVPLPAIPVISSISSLVSIMMACVRLNIPQPYQSYAEPNFCKRHSKRFSQVMGHLPFFLCSVLFRVMSYAFMWIYLWFYSFIPLTVSFFANLVIGYNQQTDTKMKKGMRTIKKKIKKHFKENQEEYKHRRIELAVWLSSFIGIFIPCCYSQQLEDKIVKKLWNKPDILKGLDDVRQSFQNKVLKKQELAGTLINLVSSVAIFIMVNFTEYKYSDNKLTNFSFNIYFYVVITLGIMVLIFTLLDFDALKLFGLDHIEDTETKTKISFDEPDGGTLSALPTTDTERKTEMENLKGKNSFRVRFIEKKRSKFVQMVVSMFLSLLVFTPIVIGGFCSHHYTLPEGYAVLVPDPAASDNQLYMIMVKVYPVNSGTEEDLVGSFIKCTKYFTEPSLSNSRLVVYADLSIPECEKHLIDKAGFEAKMRKRSNKDVLLIAENWNNRSSSSFPSMTYNEKTDTFTDKSIAHLKSFDDIPILSFNQKDKESFEMHGFTSNQEIRIAMKDIPDLLKPDSLLLSVECDDTECIHIDTELELDGSQVFLGCDSEPKRNINVTISCNDRGKNCTEFDRFKKTHSQETSESCRKKVITPSYFGDIVALKCKGKSDPKIWNKKNDLLLCQDEKRNEGMSTKTCCTKNRTTIYAKKGCKDPKKNHCEHGWGSWSGWNSQEDNLVRDRSRFCFIDKACTYLETEYWKLDEDDRDDREDCGRDDIFNKHECIDF
eukprot:GFUD01000076.1.p1 GENE.GFUD01000076.1~~GFUD01000076.1.p1  ORF type:complete len:1104 (-),score=226.04 GFUD01000076.1:19-3330(-)